MTPSAILVGMPPRCPPPAVAVAFSPRRGGFCRPVFAAAACGGGGEEEEKQMPMPMPPSMAAMPASLRAIQAKRKLEAVRRGVVPRVAGTSAVAALVAAVQGAASGGAAEAARGAASDAMAWVIRKVHLESPDLAVGLLGLVASCLGTVVEAEMDRVKSKQAEASASASASASRDADTGDGDTDAQIDDADADAEMSELVELDMETELWSRIGIMHRDAAADDDDTPAFVDDEDDLQEIIDIARVHRRKAAYERTIATAAADVNSLILSNYAQLLYQFDKDLDRAEDYFKQAVAASPVDGEAMRRYALFMWHARGDLVGAEEMFTRAIDEEPQSSQHRSSYAWFLWMTGGVETCLIDSGNDAE